MRLSTLFGKTLREVPADTDLASRQLALRAALLRSTGGGDVYLPLGWRVRERLQRIIRAELDALGGQEFYAPGVPAPGVPGDTAAFVADLCRRDIISYRDLPKVFYGFGASARGYALNADTNSLLTACLRVLEICEVKATGVEMDDGVEFILPRPKGTDIFLQCDSCGYAALPETAEFNIDPCGGSGEGPLPLEKVATPNCNTIASLALFLNLPKCQTLKAVMFTYDEREFVFVVVRGDLDVSEQKVRRTLGGGPLRPASEAEIIAAGAVPGYASPRGLRVAQRPPTTTGKGDSPLSAAQGTSLVTVIVDESIHAGANYAAGANEAGYHFINVNYPRDFAATLVTRVALPVDGLGCGDCGNGLLREIMGDQLAHCRHAELAATFLDASGRPQPIAMEVCEIATDRLLAAVIETHHDEAGIIWPELVAPFQYHLLRLGKAPDTLVAADQLYAELIMAGRTVLYDDRDESAGVKFADADLLGLPTRITVSDKSLQAGGAEIKRRASAEKEIVPLESIK